MTGVFAINVALHTKETELGTQENLSVNEAGLKSGGLQCSTSQFNTEISYGFVQHNNT